jgi:hypothetical protein
MAAMAAMTIAIATGHFRCRAEQKGRGGKRRDDLSHGFMTSFDRRRS